MITYIPFRWTGKPGGSAHALIGPPSDYTTAKNFTDKFGSAHGVDANEDQRWWLDVQAPIVETVCSDNNVWVPDVGPDGINK